MTAGILDRPKLVVECAFASNPFVALTDERLAWIDITDSLELEKGVSIARRRANELDDPSSGTGSLWLNNADGRFTRLNTSGPYYPYVKNNRLLRLRAVWPSEPVNLLTQRQATGGQSLAGTDPEPGFSVPSGTLTYPTVTATASLAGTTTTFKCLDAAAAGIEVGDVVSVAPAMNPNCGFESGTTGWTGSGGTLTQANDQLYSGSWSGKLTPDGVSVFPFVATAFNTFTSGDTYKASAWVRCTAARTVYLQIHWYDATATFLSQSVASLAVGAGVWTKLTLTATAPLGATQGPMLITMDGTPPAVEPMWIDEAAVRTTDTPTAVYAVTGKSSAAGTTTFTFTPAAPSATVPGDEITRSRAQWDTGLQPVTGGRFAAGSTGTTWAGPDALTVTAGTSYTFSVWAERGATAVSVSPRIAWYDLTGTLISETVGGTVALTTSLQRLTLTATAPAGARLARVSVANETILAGSPSVAFRAAAEATKNYGSSLPITVPATVQAGDTLLMWVAQGKGSAMQVATPAGWTLVADDVTGASPWQGRVYLFRATATASGATTSAGKSFSLTATASSSFVAAMVAYSGCDPAGPIHQSAHAVQASGVYSTTHTTPNVTTTVANCWIVSACFDRSGTTVSWTPPAGDTLRADVFTTGGGASTGMVSDNAAPVAAGTYGSKVCTGTNATDQSAMWTVALKPSPASGGSSATIQLTGPQFEQAASVSVWSLPSASFMRFIGHVDRWPTQWDGGVWAVANVTATDRTKLLADDEVRAAITEQVLNGSLTAPGLDGPVAYYPLGEDSGATAAGNEATTPQPSLAVMSVGAATDEMLEFGGGTGPGADAQPALKLTPTSASVGKALRGVLTTPLGGDGVTEMTVAGWFNTTVTGSSTRVICGADDGYPNDGGADGLFDLGLNQSSPFLRAHLKMPGATAEIFCDQATNYSDGHTHLASATAAISGGVITVKLYLDGVLKNTSTTTTTVGDFSELTRFNVGCNAFDTINRIWSGTLSHCAAWNRALSATEMAGLYTAGSTGFAGDSPGDRCDRIAAWKGLTSTSFEQGDPTTLASHPAGGQEMLEAFKQVARSDGGLFFVDRTGLATLQAHGHRVGADPVFTLTADQLEGDIVWDEDPALVGNDGTVAWGTDGSVRVVDQASIDEYGRQKFDLQTILEDDTQASDRAAAYLARYREPISRPSEVTVEALNKPSLWAALLGTEYGQKFSITQLPTGAPATAADLFIEGIGEEINADSWRFSFDCSPAGFDFGLILDDPVRGLLDLNYVGW